MRKALLKLRAQRIVIGVDVSFDLLKLAQFRPRTAGSNRAWAGFGIIEGPDPLQLMALVPKVAHLQNQILSELPLDVEQVLEDIGCAVSVGFSKHKGRGQYRRRPGGQAVKGGDKGKVREAVIGRIGDPSRQVASKLKVIVAGILHEEDAESAAHGPL